MTKFESQENPVVPKLRPHLSEREIDRLERMESEVLQAESAAKWHYERGEYATAEDWDVRASELQQLLEEVASEIEEGGTHQVGGSEAREGFSRDMTLFLAKTWGEYVRYQRTGWAMGGLDLSDKSKLIDYLRMVLRYDLKPSVTNPQLLEAAEDAYEARIGYFERGQATAAREDEILAKMGNVEAQRRVYRAALKQEQPGRVVLPSENPKILGRALADLRPALAAAAQAIVDKWEQDEDGIDEELGGGGVCDQVAEAMIDVLYTNLEGIEATCGAPEGEDHEWVVVTDRKHAFIVDIPPGVYETGGGYSWRKVEDVVIKPEDVLIDTLNLDLVGELFEEPS